ncbi:MAG: 16S rRNA (guanine(527)-N(7))-methyltransferase RsmG [Dongiaceae bacterium]
MDPGRAAFAAFLRGLPANVSRETDGDFLTILDSYATLLAKWQARINLVGPATLPDLWRRHFLDSAQLLPLIPAPLPDGGATTLVDLGSGAGFPGLVLAILRPDLVVTLIESDGRKATFLAEAARATLGPAAKDRVTVLRARAESLDPIPADLVTARALAPLARLLALAEPWLSAETLCLFPKGADAAAELTEAHKGWTMTLAEHPSLTDPRATILEIRHASRRQNGR